MGRHFNFKGLFGLEIMTIPTISVHTVPQKLICSIKYNVSLFQAKCRTETGVYVYTAPFATPDETLNPAYKFVFGFDAGLTRLVKVRIVTNSSAAEGWIPTCKADKRVHHQHLKKQRDSSLM